MEMKTPNCQQNFNPPSWKVRFLSISFVLFQLTSPICAQQGGPEYLFLDNFQKATVYEAPPAFLEDLEQYTVKRYREVELSAKVTRQNSFVEGEKIVLNIFEDRIYEAIIGKISVNRYGTITVRANVVDYPSSYIAFHTTEGNTFGVINIYNRGEVYQIRKDPTKQNTYIVIEVEFIPEDYYDHLPDRQGSSLLNEFEKIEQEKLLATVAEKGLSPSDPAHIDILIVYTNAYLQFLETVGMNINNAVQEAFENANAVLTNSQTNLFLNNVHTSLVPYVESGDFIKDHDRLTATSYWTLADMLIFVKKEDRMPTVHQLRDQYGADLVVLATNNPSGTGVAWELTNQSGRPSRGFAVVNRDLLYTNSDNTFIHEIGHLLGAGHNRYQQDSPGPQLFNYSSGWHWTATPSPGYFCSVMSYRYSQYGDGNDYSRQPYFSNPDVTHHGVPTGHPTEANNARTIRETKHGIANYRNSSGAVVGVNPEEVDFGNVSVGSNSTISYTVSGQNLEGNLSVLAPDGFLVSLSQNSGYSSTLSIPPTNGTIYSTVYVKFSPAIPGEFFDYVANHSTGTTQQDVTVSGVGEPFGLNNGLVSPSSGTNTDTFAFSVTYQGSTAPDANSIKVQGYGWEHTLTANSSNWNNGVAFSKSVGGFSPGNYSFYFTGSAEGKTLRFPETGFLSLSVSENVVGWDANVTSLTANRYYFSGGTNIVAYGTVRNDSDPGNIYYNLPVKFEMFNPSGIRIHESGGTIPQLNPGQSLNIQTPQIPVASGDPDGIYQILFTASPSKDSDRSNNSRTINIIKGELGASQQFHIKSNDWYVNLVGLQEYTFANNKYKFIGIASSGRAIFLNPNGDYIDIDLNDFKEDQGGNVAIIYAIRISNSDAYFHFGLRNSSIIEYDNTEISGFPGQKVEFIAHTKSPNALRTASNFYSDPSNIKSWFDSKSTELYNGNRSIKRYFTIPQSASPGRRTFYFLTGINQSNEYVMSRLRITVLQPPPQISSLSKYSFSSGEEITITGSSFGTATGQVKFNELNGVIKTWTNTSITCVVPDGIADGLLSVVNSAGSSNGVSYQAMYNITASVEPAEAGLITGAGTYSYGATVNLTATANSGWEFLRWTEGESEVSVEEIFGFEATTNRSLAAYFLLLNEGPPEIRFVQQEAIGQAESDCLDALQTISVSDFTVQPGGNVSLIAGANIIFGPGTIVHPGGYLHAYITTDGTFCNDLKKHFLEPEELPEVIADIPKDEKSDNDQIQELPQDASFKVYPNPTPGIFTLELNGFASDDSISVEVFGLRGETILRKKLTVEQQLHTLSIEGHQPGMYFIRVMSGQQVDVERIIKR